MPTDVILGTKFLSVNNAIINVKKNSLILNNNKLELLKPHVKTEQLNEAETQLIENVYQIKDLDKKEIIEKYTPLKSQENKIPNVEHHIKLKDVNKITQAKQFRIPYKQYNQFRKDLTRLKEKDIIEESQNKFSAPAFVIPKRSGELRMVIDFRTLNKNTIEEPVYFPSNEELIYNLREANVFSLLDLQSGYHHIKMAEEDNIYDSIWTL